MGETINEAISESIEPRPTWPDPQYQPDGAVSKELAWIWLVGRDSADGEGGWIPREWHTDENASAMLLERMAKPRLELFPVGVRWWRCWVNAEEIKSPTFADGEGLDRKTAIRDAYYAQLKESK